MYISNLANCHFLCFVFSSNILEFFITPILLLTIIILKPVHFMNILDYI